MTFEDLPDAIRDRYHVASRRHALAILSGDFPAEYQDLIDCLNQFELLRSEIVAGGGGKSKVSSRLDRFLTARGWNEQSLNVSRTIGERVAESHTHKVDQFKNRIAIEVEWNNKDPFFARDLAAFRLFHELDEISVGVIITRGEELQSLFDSLGFVQDKHGKWAPVGGKYGASTTHWSKLIGPVESGAHGTCPILLFGIKTECYRDDIPDVPILKKPPV